MTRSFAAIREMDPTQDQVQILLRHVGAVRFAQNWALRFIKDQMDAHEFQSWSSISLHTAWREHRDEVAIDKETGETWWQEVSKETFQYGCERLALGLKNWKDSKSGKRKGPKVNFPKKRKRGKNDSVYYYFANLKSSTTVHIPRVGTIMLKESFEVPEDCKVTGVVIKQKANRWFITFKIKEKDWKEPAKKEIKNVVGVDAGVGDNFAAFSSGEVVENPRFFRRKEKRIAKASRRLSRKQKGSKNRAKARIKLNRVHMRISNQRADFVHKFTTNLVKTHDEIVIEDLNLHAMGSKRGFKLGKSVHDVAWGEVRRQLTYKCSWYGTTLTVVSRWFPSSKMCFECKEVNKDLNLSQRVWICPACGAKLDRDLNAARNLAAESITAGSISVDACGADVSQELVLAIGSETGKSNREITDLLAYVSKK